MANTYPDDAENIEKIAEELRLIRCVLERFLHSRDRLEYLVYEEEKVRFYKRNKGDKE